MRLFTALALLACLTIVTTSGARAWGAKGHRIINEDAARALPTSVPAFVRTPEAIAEITALGPEADRLKGAGVMWDSEFDPGHYLDLDDDGTIAGVVPLADLPPTRAAYDTAVRKGHPIEGHAPDQWRVGYLPYSIIEDYEQVVQDFAWWRVDSYGATHASDAPTRAAFDADRKLRETLTLRDIGYWGHFIADGSQPLHVSVHYNGWGPYPNPNNYTESKTTHADFETTFVNAHASADLVQPRIAPFVASAVPFATQVEAYLKATNAGVPTVYRLTDAGAFAAATPESIGFTLDRLAAGAQMFRDAIVEAWIASSNAKVGYPAVSAHDVESGDAYPPLPAANN
jgi:hypothetical protein